ncbi:GtrA family protein [Salinibacterium sp.]|uniref:GtrA family protein n=1 Tax=Salinibacterium sp. TaxID=1915057 RepID=UPI00286BA541|nr:GtrA family protein [Salinibacterium sp.]
MRRFITQLARFGVVGLIGLVIDVSVFNLLRATVLEPSVVHAGPFIAKVISTMLAIAANYVGNRYWTFRATKRSTMLREGLEFVAVSVGGMLIALSCLWVSHYLLGFTSVLADNISSNVVGLALGTAFRFAFYRYWVFHPNRERPLRDEADAANDSVQDAAITTPTEAAARRR